MDNDDLPDHPPPLLQRRLWLSRLSRGRRDDARVVKVEGPRAHHLLGRSFRILERKVLPRPQVLLRIRRDIHHLRSHQFFWRNFHSVLRSRSSITRVITWFFLKIV